ncbi:hypothetical protein F4813DRAFT_382228 [Daldinia decipiens]|uniref:uncharacterized protein n=1 Tax=Daldinia decipiens TaxID=326647 RepID=UPI0020C550BA|nr:uncharacterized protein F4813DRAFT_382228 [Daldinia decipiens]KAI1655025.1 hypothetical protein F4813DRAFT_382228 [Daldinia decipiens]
MLPNAGVETADTTEQSRPTRQKNLAGERKSRKRRVRLSCMECRKKKSPPSFNFTVISQEKQIQDLQAQVAELKVLLSKVLPTGETDCVVETSCVVSDHAKSNSSVLLNGKSGDFESLTSKACDGDNSQPDSASLLGSKSDHDTTHVNNTELCDPKERFPQGYYSRHNLFRFFGEIRELFPFIRETANEWFKPLGVSLTREKSSKNGYNVDYSPRKGVILECLLPPKEDTGALVSFCLDGLEQIHRIIHIPTFKREYASFWLPQRARYPAMTALILAMISISTYATTLSAEATSIPTKYRAMCARWIYSSEEWLKQQGPKHRKIVHYQISCLVYLAKRVAMIGKKRWWKETSSLIQDAIIDGLHCDLSSNIGTPYTQEMKRRMKRRIWTVLRELDLQNAFEYGLPTLLHNINSDIPPPMNLDDDDFGEALKEIPTSKPLDVYTLTSYQVHSARSWALRLEISQRLFNRRLSKDLIYDEVLRYTHEITQAIEAIPSWNKENTTPRDNSKLSILANAFCLFQLKECVLALHRPYLHKNDSRYWLSETVCYHTSRDILLLNSRLAEFGCQSLATVRDDLLLASLSLVRITILQPELSNNIIVTDSQAIINLLEQCVPLMEDRHLRCCYSEPDILILLNNRNYNPSLYLYAGYYQVDTYQLTAPEAPDFPVSGWLDDSFPEVRIETPETSS